MRAILHKVIRSLYESGADLQWAPDYAEPGYAAGEDGVYFANWNPRSFSPREDTVLSRLGACLERDHVDMEWSDEWSTCGECGRAVRTSADSYSWVPYFKILNECELVCADCILEDPGDYEAYLVNDPDRADTFGVNWAERGWRKVKDCETGWHPGQTDDPADIFERASRLWDVIFVIDAVGQFDTRWSVWIKDPE